MGACRNLMPVNLLEDWRDWLVSKGHDVQDTRAPYGVFALRFSGKTYVVYNRLETTAGNKLVHASLHGPLVGLARRFLNERKRGNNADTR